MKTLKNKLIIAICSLILFNSCNNSNSRNSETNADKSIISIQTEEHEANIDMVIEIQEDEPDVDLVYFEIPQKSSFQEVIANFYQYRDDNRLFEGLDSITENYYIRLAKWDTLLIFNYDKGTVRGVNRIWHDENYCYVNYIKGFPAEPTISGDFNGDGKKDTLLVDNFDLVLQKHFNLELDSFNFVFSDKTIPKLGVWGNLDFTIKNEGDLDGDGGDEIGFLYGWYTSNCRTYRVFTFKNNKWYRLIEGVESTYDTRATGIVPVEKDPEQDDVILIRSSKVLYCNRSSYIVEKSVKIKDLIQNLWKLQEN